MFDMKPTVQKYSGMEILIALGRFLIRQCPICERQLTVPSCWTSAKCPCGQQLWFQ